MSKKNIFNIVASVTVIGIFVSFMLYFLITAWFGGNTAEMEYYGGKNDVCAGAFAFIDDACLKNTEFHSYIKKAEYGMFGSVSTGSVLSGKDGFLFMAGANKDGYNYLDDYLGKLTIEKDELDRFYQCIEMRRKAYENEDREYMLVVIPNSQTIYSEYMPDYIGKISDNTMLSQLASYMSEKDCGYFLDLTEPLREAKSKGLIYNNTENSINAFGAYYVYDAIMKAMPASVTATLRERPISDFSYSTHFTDGKTAATVAGLSSFVKNKTVSMSTSINYKYTMVELFEDIETTYSKTDYRDEIPLKPSVLIEFTDDWDKIQLEPYFSNTFGMASYRTNQIYSRSSIENTNPLMVVQIIHEDELWSLLGNSAVASYSDVLLPGQNPYETTKPASVRYSVLDEKRVCITGIVEEGAVITVFGDDFDSFNLGEIDGVFYAVVDFDDPALGKEIFLTAKAEGKLVSQPVSVIVEKTRENLNVNEALVGKNSMIFSADYATNTVSESKIRAFTEMIGAEFETIRNQAGNDDLEIIFVIVPDKLSVYSDYAPDELEKQLVNFEKNRGLFSEILENEGVTVLDMAPYLRGLVGEEKLFRQLSETMTDFGYYRMYTKIMQYVSGRFESAEPMTLERFLMKNYKPVGGKNAYALGFGDSVLEPIVKLSLPEEVKYIYTSPENDKSDTLISHKYVSGLPSAIVVRDSSENTMIDYLSEHFTTLYVLPEGETNISERMIDNVEPDYIIYICNENNIDFGVD